MRGVENHSLYRNALTNDYNVKTAMTVNDTSLSNLAKPKKCCDNRQVEAEREGWSKVKATRLCACTQQHHVRSVAALSGERAEPVPLTSACTGHKLTVAQHTQHPTITGISASGKLANSPIIIDNLNKQLEEYPLVNGPMPLN
jgi:hypothetical protein